MKLTLQYLGESLQLFNSACEKGRVTYGFGAWGDGNQCPRPCSWLSIIAGRYSLVFISWDHGVDFSCSVCGEPPQREAEDHSRGFRLSREGQRQLRSEQRTVNRGGISRSNF